MVPSLEYLDRYRNEGTRTYSPHADYTEAEERYRPRSGTDTFDLTVFDMPAETVNIYTANPSAELAAKYLPEERALLCIHPQVMSRHSGDPYVQRARTLGRPHPAIPVTPSSSTRTLFARHTGPPHAIKVHFPFRVSRYGRKMRDEVVQQAISVSWEMEGGIHRLGDDFAFLREVLGVTQKNLEPHSARGENWGYLVRDMAPWPEVEDERALVPGFSLYGRDYFDPTQPILLLELMGSEEPKAFVLEAILFPVLRHWARCFLELGLILEPHGQNSLLELDSRGRIRRVVHRDLNLGIDMRRRRDIGLPEGGLNTYNRMESGEFASIAYDKFMGGHFFDRIASALEEADPAMAAEDLRGPCREEFARVFPDHGAYLPRTVQYFSEERDEFGKPLLKDTGLPPQWRP